MEPDNRQILGEIASEAALERKEFLVEATDQLRRFLDGQAERIRELGGMVLIDEDPDYLSIAPDGSPKRHARQRGCPRSRLRRAS